MSASGQTGGFIVSGPPGAGKGTIARLCEQRLGWVQLSTGDLFRKHIAEQTELGRQIDFAIKSGRLVDDQLVIETVAQWLERHIKVASGIVFDGFPRTLVQAQLFIALVKDRFQSLKLTVIDFQVERQELVDRLSSRRTCSNKRCQAVYSIRKGSSQQPKVPGICDVCGSQLIQRADDVPAVIETRLDVYYQHAQAVLDFYKQQGLCIVALNGEMPLEELFQNLMQVSKRGDCNKK